MNGAQIPIDWSFLLGAEVIQIAIGQHQMQIHLFDAVNISFENKFAVDDRLWEEEDSPGDKGPALIALLGAKVTGFKAEANESLLLIFDTGKTLRLFTRPDGFEAFSISTKEGTWIILDRLSYEPPQ